LCGRPRATVCDAALEVTMCPMVHSFHSVRTSGGVAAAGEV
jgi:hypothetical protein